MFIQTKDTSNKHVKSFDFVIPEISCTFALQKLSMRLQNVSGRAVALA